MLIRFSFILVILTSFFTGFSQEIESDSGPKTENSEIAKNTFYAEILGKGYIWSINYERSLFNITDDLKLNASIGYSLFDSFTKSAFDPIAGDSLTKKEQKDLLKERTSRKRMPGFDRFIPLELNLRYSFGSHHAIFGFGTTYMSYEIIDIEIDNLNVADAPAPATLVKKEEWFGHLTFEYKYQKPEGGLMLKAGFTPLYFAKMNNSAFTKKANYQASVNLGIGWSF